MLIDIIVVCDDASKPALQRTLDSVPPEWKARRFTVTEADVAEIVPPNVLPGTVEWQEVAIKWALSNLTLCSPWAMVLLAGDVVPNEAGGEGHAAARAVAPQYMPPNHVYITQEEAMVLGYKDTVIAVDPSSLPDTLSTLPTEVTSGTVLVFHVEDSKGTLARAVQRQCVLVKRGAAYSWTPFGFAAEGQMALLPHHPILRQPVSALLFEQKKFNAARVTAASRMSMNNIDRRIYVKARTECETKEALAALKTLFMHCSLYEELYPIREIMKRLPYTLEEHPEVEVLRRLLYEQIKHLDTGEESWYRDGSPGEILTPELVADVRRPATHRARWLAEQALANGFQKVVEMGSVDGCNLFDLIKLAPGVEWHGVEVNPKAVAHAKMLAEKVGMRVPFNMHNASFSKFADDHIGYFDAAAVFEVLEHNWDPHDILNDAETCVRDGGRVYITTPNGAWSPHNDDTRSITLRKDHIRAWTVKRMRSMLEARKLYGIDDIVVMEVENPNWVEGNSWVYATYRVGS